MTEEQAVLQQIQEYISQLSSAEQAAIAGQALALRRWLATGVGYTNIALALVSAELAANED